MAKLPCEDLTITDEETRAVFVYVHPYQPRDDRCHPLRLRPQAGPHRLLRLVDIRPASRLTFPAHGQEETRTYL